jgi:PAS domain S-box-containing protein
MTPDSQPRILLVDDNPEIHLDYRKILVSGQSRIEPSAESPLRLSRPPAKPIIFEVDSAYQGREALEKVLQSLTDERPYSMAFVDMHMPPGWDGLETIEHLWHADPELQIVICTACDFSWGKMRARLGVNDNLLILKKPFDNIEVIQLAHSMTRKWFVTKQAGAHLELLDRMVSDRTRDLQKTNAELRRTEERFSTAFMASPVPLAIQTLSDDRFIDVNDAFLVLTGFKREELVGRTPVEARMCIDYDSSALQALRAGRQIHNSEARVSTKRWRSPVGARLDRAHGHRR